jgi:hypothetical protein
MGRRRSYNLLTCVIQSSKSTSLRLLLRLMVMAVLLLGRRAAAAVSRDRRAGRRGLAMIKVVVLVPASARFLVSTSLLVAQERGHSAVITSPATRGAIVTVPAAERIST